MQRYVQYGAEQVFTMMKPTKVNGKWKKPIISKRNCAEIRKSSILNGTFGTWETGKGGWLEEWDGTKRHIVMKPLKLTADERNMDARYVIVFSNWLVLHLLK